MIIRVWHNEDRNHFFGYEYGANLVPVFTYRESAAQSRSTATDLELCNRAYHLFNVGDDPEFGEPHPFAIAYRMAGHRSLSVGDVVQVEQRFYACESVGWRMLVPDEALFYILHVRDDETIAEE